MFINTRANIKITSDNGTKFEARAGWIGEVPQWVANHWYFKALCKDGTVTAIVTSNATPVTAPAQGSIPPGNSGDAELAALRARAAELKIPQSAKLSKDKLIAAIQEAEEKAKKASGEKTDPLDGMDAPALREFAAKNGIDLSGVAENATADDLRLIIKKATEGKPDLLADMNANLPS